MTLLWEAQIKDGMRQLGLNTSPENLSTYGLLVEVDEHYLDCIKVARDAHDEAEYVNANGRAQELYSFVGAIIRNEAIAHLMPDFGAIWRARWQEIMKAWMMTDVTYWTDARDNASTAEEKARYQGHVDGLEWLESVIELF